MSQMDAQWHADPTGRHRLRWWDGRAWSDYVADGGVPTAIDPVAGPPVMAPIPPAYATAAPVHYRYQPHAPATVGGTSTCPTAFR